MEKLEIFFGKIRLLFQQQDAEIVALKAGKTTELVSIPTKIPTLVDPNRATHTHEVILCDDPSCNFQFWHDPKVMELIPESLKPWVGRDPNKAIVAMQVGLAEKLRLLTGRTGRWKGFQWQWKKIINAKTIGLALALITTLIAGLNGDAILEVFSR